MLGQFERKTIFASWTSKPAFSIAFLANFSASADPVIALPFLHEAYSQRLGWSLTISLPLLSPAESSPKLFC
jgi:hypothetical protein